MRAESEKISPKNLNREERKKRRKWLSGYAYRTKGLLISGILLLLFSVAFDLAGPYIISYLLDRVFPSIKGAEKLPQMFGLILSLYLGSSFISSGLGYLSNVRLADSAGRVSMWLQEDCFRHMQRMPMSYFDRLPAGSIVSRITNDAQVVKNFYQLVLAQLCRAAVYGTGIVFALAFIDLRLAGIALAAFPLIYIVMKDYKNKSEKYSASYRRNNSKLNAVMNESLQGISVIKSLGCEDKAESEFSEVNSALYRDGKKLSVLYAYSAYNITQALQYVFLILVLLVFGLGRLYNFEIMPIGALYIFLDYMTRLFDELSAAMSRVGDMERAFAASDHMHELMMMPEEKDVSSGCEAKKLERGISFESACFSYTEDSPEVLKDFDLFIPAGRTTAIVGSTGAGKSTLINLLSGFYRLDGGNIFFDRQEISSISAASLRKKMAIVLQDPYLFDGDIYQNISMGDPNIGPEAAKTAMQRLGAGELLSRLPKGIYSEVSGGGDISAGEAQLISFARAMVRDPEILILDEATSSIDTETERLIQRAIRELSGGRTAIVIAHRLSTVRLADKIAVIHRGRVTESGTHDELMNLGGEYKRLYTLSLSSENNRV